MRSFANIVARNSIIALISKFTIKLISFAFTIWIARSLGEADFGHYALIWSFVTIFATASDLGLGMYTIREMAKGTKPHLAENVIVFRLLLAAITFLLITLTAQIPNYPPGVTHHIVLAGLILLLYAIQDPLDSVLQAKERVDISSILHIVEQLVFVVLGGLFLWAEWGITGLIIASFCNIGISALLAWRTINRGLGGLNWHIQPGLWPKLLFSALPFGIIGFAQNWSQKIDTVILSIYWPAATVGWYNAAYSLILGMVIVSNAFNVALYPTMSKEAVSSNQLLRQAYKRIFKYLFIASLPLAIGLSVLSRPIVLTLFGDAFAPAILPLTILAWVLPLIFISQFLRYIALVVGQERRASVGMLFAAVVNIISNLCFIPSFGLVAAAIITIFTEAFIVSIYLYQLRTEISFSSVSASFWKPAFASGLMSIVLLLAVNTSLLLLLVLAVLSGLIYFLVLILLGDFDQEERFLLQGIFRRILSATP